MNSNNSHRTLCILQFTVLFKENKVIRGLGCSCWANSVSTGRQWVTSSTADRGCKSGLRSVCDLWASADWDLSRQAIWKHLMLFSCLLMHNFLSTPADYSVYRFILGLSPLFVWFKNSETELSDSSVDNSPIRTDLNCTDVWWLLSLWSGRWEQQLEETKNNWRDFKLWKCSCEKC